MSDGLWGVIIWGAPSSQHLVPMTYAITSPQKNNLFTEELRDGAKSLDYRSVYHLEKLHSVVYFLVEKGDSGADSCIEFYLGRLFQS